ASTSIQLEGSFEGLSEYQILNVQGQIVLTGKTTSGEQIQINSLSAGTYYIHWNYQNADNKQISNISRFVKTN
ncbi:MAG TPA: T9SS type A sorting domain-containing protein, partial [Saprospiraceae bacterium]|nr:T9SS type A sorting domain-containing protein [Saprospiraceae bacterium]